MGGFVIFILVLFLFGAWAEFCGGILRSLLALWGLIFIFLVGWMWYHISIDSYHASASKCTTSYSCSNKQ